MTKGILPELGGNILPEREKRLKLKKCDYCLDLVSIRYRIQYDESRKWSQVCPQCWQLLAEDNPNYRYGGTWKAR